MRLLALLLLCVSSSLHAADVLHLYNRNNYISDATVARFEAACRCRLVQDYYSDKEESRPSWRPVRPATTSSYPLATRSLIKSRQLRPLNKRQLRYIDNIDPAHLDSAFDPGNAFRRLRLRHHSDRLQRRENARTESAHRHLGGDL